MFYNIADGASRRGESLLANGTGRPVLLHRQLTGDLLVRPPSTMSVTPAKTVDRRLSAELRTQLERTRRTRFSDELKVSLALLVVIAVFVVSWAPISLVNAVQTVFMVSWAPISLVNAVETFNVAVTPRSLERAAVCMLFLQSAVNPLVYGVMNRNFREVFRNLLRVGAPRR